MMRHAILVTAVVLACLYGFSGVAVHATVWSIQTVDSGGDVGSFNSLALSSDGQPRISYFDATNFDLKYAARNGSSWNIQPVDSTGNVGLSPSLALDSSDHPHIAYGAWLGSPPYSDLKYAAWNGSSWGIQTAYYGSHTGNQVSLALDSGDAPHIASYQSWPYGNLLRYTYWNGSAWSSGTPGGGGNGVIGISLGLDGSDNPHLSYYDYQSQGLRYLARNGSWASQLLDAVPYVSGTVLDTSLVVDGSGNPHISYLIGAGVLKYAAWDGSAWHIDTVDCTTFANWTTALALDASGDPHIVYYDDTNNDIKYAAWDACASSWDIETVASVDIGEWSDLGLAVDSCGNVHISYYDATNGDLKYAYGAIPEPLTMLGMFLGLGGVGAYIRKRRRA